MFKCLFPSKKNITLLYRHGRFWPLIGRHDSGLSQSICHWWKRLLYRPAERGLVKNWIKNVEAQFSDIYRNIYRY